MSQVIYSRADRDNTQSTIYVGAESVGDGWSIRWAGPYNKGPQAIDVLRAALDHLTHLQQTTNGASESNAKLIVHLVKAIQEFDGVRPTIGGELNNLIPEQ